MKSQLKSKLERGDFVILKLRERKTLTGEFQAMGSVFVVLEKENSTYHVPLQNVLWIKHPEGDSEEGGEENGRHPG